MIDRFGLLPQQIKNLFAITALKLRCQVIGIRKLDLDSKGGRILFRAKPDIDPMTIIRMIQSAPKTYALDGQDKLKLRQDLPEPAQRLAMAERLLQMLGKNA
jgi:transcription-repair coupling factor (superfamily II helicase)